MENPVRDYIPNFFKIESNEHLQDTQRFAVKQHDNEPVKEIHSEGEAGFLDFIEDIKESSDKITNEILSIGSEMDEMNASIKSATNEIDRIKIESGSVNANFARNICRKLSEPIDKFSIKLKDHISEVSRYWTAVENGYLSLLDSTFVKSENNIHNLKDSMGVMKHMQNEIHNSDKSIESFVTVLRTCLGMERKLNRSISSLIFELEEYLKLTNTMSSSIDRIISKCNVVTDNLKASMALPPVSYHDN
ncbi:MAG: hypothetical protein LUG88_04805 [Clostridia bacterium]|nr:hypothetical protein [Clostridia bacterium]